MSKNHKNLITILLIVLIIFLGVGLFLYFNKGEVKEVNIINQNISENLDSSGSKELIENTNNKDKVSLNILDKIYEVEIVEGDTVYSAMEKLQEQEDEGFYFKGKEYSGMGIFIDEINDIKGENGKYWLYYINDVEASMSVSKQVLRNGDIISWKLK